MTLPCPEPLTSASLSAGGDEGGNASSDLVAASSYLDMLTDERRNRAYRLALEAVVRPGNTVLDIGEVASPFTGMHSCPSEGTGTPVGLV